MIENLNKSELGNTREIDKNYSIIAQIIVDSYLQFKDGITMKEFLEKKGLENKPGLIYDYHVVMLQTMFDDEYKLLGTDLATEILKNGEEFISGKLSNFENKLLANKVIFTTNVMNVLKNNLEQK